MELVIVADAEELTMAKMHAKRQVALVEMRSLA